MDRIRNPAHPVILSILFTLLDTGHTLLSRQLMSRVFGLDSIGVHSRNTSREHEKRPEKYESVRSVTSQGSGQ